MQEDTRKLLLQCDEPDVYEYPRNFDYAKLEKRALRVERRLKEELGEHTSFEDANYNQDASFSVAIALHGYESTVGKSLYLPCLRFSNFGNLVSACMDEMIPTERLRIIIDIVQAEGFHFIPFSELDAPYDGIMSAKWDTTWWIRYFDWL